MTVRREKHDWRRGRKRNWFEVGPHDDLDDQKMTRFHQSQFLYINVIEGGKK